MMTNETGQPPVKAPRNGWRTGFFALLAANLAVIGLLTGVFLRDGGPGHRMFRDMAFGPFTEALSDEDRGALRRGFLERMPDFRAERKAMQGDLALVIGVLRAEPYAPQALRQAMDQLQAKMQSRVQLGRDLLLERIDAMDPADRQAFADRLEQGFRRGAKDQAPD